MDAMDKVKTWVNEMVQLCQPSEAYWCDGSVEEKDRLTQQAVESGELIELNQEKLPGCYLHRSHPQDVARTEGRTFICTPDKEEAGPTNNWMAPAEAYSKLTPIFRGSMKGKTMYVIPFIMGIPHSPFSKVGIQLTDSIYVVLNMRIMTRMGKVALEELKQLDSRPRGNDTLKEVFTKCLHSRATLDTQYRYICHFPGDNTIWSVNSAYGGNALLGKKCLALRIASYLGRQEGWLAEHMLILGLQDPQGQITYMAAAFPSSCGKTNLAMLVPPASQPGYKIWTVGDDIAWLRFGPDGRLWAINPEAGFFGVAPGTSFKTNPHAMTTLQHNTIFTNVLLTPEGTVWWEGMDGEPPKKGTDWRGRPWTPASPEKGAHPNARFTSPASQCPCASPERENPKGVPLSAIIFGGRRSDVTPLVYETLDWKAGVLAGATMGSETTAAATGKVGVVRRDPMAMLPFCGYNMADYFSHWLSMGQKMSRPPKIFHVNWFRKDAQGKFLWPGFGENIRALKWILARCRGEGRAVQTPIGYLPHPEDLDTKGLELPPSTLQALLSVDTNLWKKEVEDQKKFFSQFKSRFPKALQEEHQALEKRLNQGL